MKTYTYKNLWDARGLLGENVIANGRKGKLIAIHTRDEEQPFELKIKDGEESTFKKVAKIEKITE